MAERERRRLIKEPHTFPDGSESIHTYGFRHRKALSCLSHTPEEAISTDDVGRKIYKEEIESGVMGVEAAHIGAAITLRELRQRTADESWRVIDISPDFTVSRGFKRKAQGRWYLRHVR